MKHICCRFPLSEPVMSVLYVSILRDTLESMGHPLRGVAGLMGGLNDPRTRIPPQQFIDILSTTLSAPETNGAGFQFGQRLSLAAAGNIGQLIMAAPDVGQALRYFLDYFSLLTLSMQFETMQVSGRCMLTVEHLYRRCELPQVKWFVTETLFYSLLANVRWMTGKPLVASGLELPYEAPPHAALYDKLFGCKVRFGAPHMQAQVELDFLRTPILTANRPLMLLKERQCQESMHRLQKRFSICEQIVTLLRRAHPQIPAQEEVAEQLNLSPSSLYRKLKEASTSFQKIVDDYRRDMALSYLRHTRLSVCEIATQLGFSDSSNFRRAFKKWTGSTPAELRQTG